jgi:hypothetical protein
VITDTVVNLNDLYVRRTRKENFFKNVGVIETFCCYEASKLSSTYHTYISLLIVVKICMLTGQENQEEEEDDDWFLRWRECAP